MNIPKDSDHHVVNLASGKTADKLSADTSKWSKTVQFFVGVGGVFFFYLIYGYLQELIFKLEGFKPFGWYLTLVQFAWYTVFGTTEMKLKGSQKRKIPLRTYALLAFLTVATMGLSNSAVGYLNYPTQVIFKCCKLIPVMIGGILIQGKKYGPIDASAALCMSIGLIFFILADSTVSPNFNHAGIVMISAALCADAVIGNVQEKAIKTHNATNNEVVLYSYGIGFFYILFYLASNGTLSAGFWFFFANPVKTYGYAFIYSITGYLGIMFVLSLIRTFGALTTVTVTTCRKAVTVTLSFLFFTKPFTPQYVWSGLLVLFGIFLNVYGKNKTKINHMVFNNVGKVVRLIQQKDSKSQRCVMEA